MRIYTALLKPDAEPVLVAEGFAWGAFFLGPLWLALHRAWTAAAISLAAAVLIVTLISGPAWLVLLGGEALALGLFGFDLHRWSLEQRGYLMLHVLAGRDQDEAWMRLLARRPDLAAQFQPEAL